MRASPVVALLGPRQCGKTTLARAYAARTHAAVHYFDLEDPVDATRLAEPMLTLAPLRGLIVVDEVQRRPELFPVLRVLADRRPRRARFLVLGSASPVLLRQSSESLAGRVRHVELAGFALEEVAGRGVESMRRLWLRGAFPRAFLARSEAESRAWREDFVRTFLERDLAQLGTRTPAPALRRFWTMLAHHSSGVWNSSAIGGSLGEAHTTVRNRVDLLADTLVVRVLQPWHENLAKRQIKAPKVYVRDSGLLHTLLGIADWRSLESHPALGASWEGFVVEQLLSAPAIRDAYYWRTQAGAELDLLVTIGGRRIGIEIKYGDAPGMTKSMHVALADLALDRLLVVYPGPERYRLAPNVEVLSLADARAELAHPAKSGNAPCRARAAPTPRSVP